MLPLLQINNLQIDFAAGKETVTAVRDITLTINRNQVVGIAGESGSGKSVTSLSVLRLLSSPDARYAGGEILFSPDGKQQINLVDISTKQLREIRGKEIAMIFQEPMTSLNPVFTCGNQVMEAILLHNKISRAEAKQRTIRLFEKVKLPEPSRLFNRYPHQISGGQKQRVMIAMAMSSNPALLICDEPTTALDVTVQKTVLELIKELQRETGMGVVFITHDLGVIAEIAHKVIIMYMGSIVEEGDVSSVFKNPAHEYTKKLLASRPRPHPKQTGLHDTLIRVHELSVHYPGRKTFFGKPVEPAKAVDHISFEIFRGETLGLVGESGCGKTTLGRSLLRLIEPASGSILYKGKNILSLSANELRQFRRKVQIVFQDPYSSLNPALTIGSAIEEPLKIHDPSLTAAGRRTRVMSLLERVGLNSGHYNRYPHEFSGGQRQRIVITRALILKPEFLVCDESVSALDLSIQAQVLDLLADLKKEMGFTSLFISHDLSVVRAISDRIMVMNRGRIEETGPAEQVYQHPQAEYTRRLLGAAPAF